MRASGHCVHVPVQLRLGPSMSTGALGHCGICKPTRADCISAVRVPAWTRSAALAASELGKVQGDWIVSGMELGATLECPDDSDTGPARPTALCAHGLSNICKCRYKCECVRVAMNASK